MRCGILYIVFWLAQAASAQGTAAAPRKDPPASKSNTQNKTTAPRTPNKPGPEAGHEASVDRRVIGYKPGLNARVEKFPGNRQTVHAAGGAAVRMNSGRLTAVRTPDGTVIRHLPGGARSVEVQRPGGALVVVGGAGAGYVQRPVVTGSRQLIQRTYISSSGQVAVRAYQRYTYRGVVLDAYMPLQYYNPALYEYAATPWPVPVAYSWEWSGSPWYGYFGGYFTPYPLYPGPAYWLTDYVLASTLQEAYQENPSVARAAAGGGVGTVPSGITPEVKEILTDEVRRYLAVERASFSAETGAPSGNAGGITRSASPFPGDWPHALVVNATIESDFSAEPCILHAGDVLQVPPPTEPQGSSATVLMWASTGGCKVRTVTSVALRDLVEMQNHLRELVERGLGELQARQGRRDLPKLAGPLLQPPVPSSWASQIKPDPNVKDELRKASEAAGAEEREAVRQTLVPVTVGPGDTVETVIGVFGQPLQIVDLGPAKVYRYGDMRITFQDGKVTEIK